MSENRVVTLDYARVASPVGELVIAQGRRGLCALAFADRWKAERARLERRHGAVSWNRRDDLPDVTRPLAAYWNGRLDALERIRVDPDGTPFQKKVWSALRKIPAGRTRSYGEIAAALGRPDAARAVASANASNPVAIVVPCHRVIHADGSISGYGGGVDRKRKLLLHEGAVWKETATRPLWRR